MQLAPLPAFGPGPKAAPARRAGAAVHFEWQQLPWQRHPEDKADPVQGRPVRDARPTVSALAGAGLGWQQRPNRRPQRITHEGFHAS